MPLEPLPKTQRVVVLFEKHLFSFLKKIWVKKTFAEPLFRGRQTRSLDAKTYLKVVG